MGFCGVGTVWDDVRKGRIAWGLALFVRWLSIFPKPFRPLGGWSFGAQLCLIGLLDARVLGLLLFSDARLLLLVVRHRSEVLSREVLGSMEIQSVGTLGRACSRSLEVDFVELLQEPRLLLDIGGQA